MEMSLIEILLALLVIIQGLNFMTNLIEHLFWYNVHKEEEKLPRRGEF
jgi:hypothetical protein